MPNPATRAQTKLYARPMRRCTGLVGLLLTMTSCNTVYCGPALDLEADELRNQGPIA